jgi:hypothetical protein
MAKASTDLVIALRNTMKKIGQSNDYQWGHMGSCNCGFLAREITRLRKDQIHTSAMQGYGDWTEQLNDYCPTSGLPMDDIISQMLAIGFDTVDLKHLERLSDPKILHSLKERNLACNVKSDVIIYLKTWIVQMESALLPDIDLTEITGKYSDTILRSMEAEKLRSL